MEVAIIEEDVNAYVAAHKEIERAEATGGKVGMTVDGIGSKLLGEFTQVERERQTTELRWLDDLRQYKGRYDADTLTRIGKRSKAFVRKTRVKVKTVNSRVADLIFPAGSEKNWTLDSTPKPSLADEERERIKTQLMQVAAAAGAQVTEDAVDAAILAAAKQAAKKMSQVMEDQLVEARYKEESLKAVHSCHLYGTGVLKGPLVERKVRQRFRHEVVEQPLLINGQPVLGENGQPKTQKVQRWTQYSESYVVPFVESVPLWRFYPDMASTSLDGCRFVYEVHCMAKHELAALAKRPSFKADRIIDYMKSNPSGATARVARHFDTELKSLGDRQATQQLNQGQYELLERWGWIDGCDLKSLGVEVPPEREHESFFSNIWMLPNGQPIRAVLQPINGVTWPYHLYYFDKDETSIFGEGLAAVMRDDQSMLNAAVRLMLDNAAITSGPQLEVMVDLLHTMENVDEMVPWKIWKRNSKSGAQQAVRAIELPSRLSDLSALATMFENNTDETTAIPRYMSGENATSGAAGTASGMSMLMAAANIVIKDLISAWDEGVMRPFLEALYRWNMQFNPDNSIKGDYDVKARGTASLVAKEVRARQLNEFATLTNNPADAPLIKRDKLVRAQAEVNELSDIVKSEEEIKAEQESEQAKKQRALQEQLAQAQVDEQIGKAKRMAAEAELATKRAIETENKAKLILANIDNVIADTVSKKVEAVFAALQAGGVATRDPLTAPAADEILRSSSWVDANGDPSVAQLNGPPVQQVQSDQILLNKGQTLAPDTRLPAPVQEAEPVSGQPNMAEINAPTGMVGRRAGMETARIEQ